MKKWIAAGILLLLAAYLTIVLVIPSSIRVSSSIRIDAPSGALMRNEFEKAEWNHWWPGKPVINGKSGIGAMFDFDGQSYRIIDKKLSGFQVLIGDSDTTNSELEFSKLNAVSTRVTWRSTVQSNANPFNRLNAYRRAAKLKAGFDKLLTELSVFYQDDVKIYGLKIIPSDLQDTLLISNFRQVLSYPDESDVYKLIDEMRDYLKQLRIRETGQPMLNISRSPVGEGYVIRTAIPVDRRIPAKGNMHFKLMPPMVRMLTTDVAGGQFSADRAMQKLDDYAADHGLKLPAIPYFSLQTDRRAEPDTNKWVTRIFYPVM